MSKRKLSLEETLVRLNDEPREDRRKRHAKTISFLEKDVLGSHWFHSRPQHVQDAYRANPPWAFFVLKNDPSVPVRHFGIAEDEKEGLKVNAVVDDRPQMLKLDEIVRIDEWTDEHLQKIQTSISPAAMMEPMGFMCEKI